MPRGKYVNHKGRSRNFTNPEELQKQNDESEEGSSADEGASGFSHSKTKGPTRDKNRKQTETDESEDESDESSEDDRDAKKGVSSLIEIENPNRAIKKAAQKVTNLSIEDEPAKPELTRREREAIEKQKAKLRYEKLHAEGKTSQAKADLARLAIIKQQRADAAAKREAEKKEREKKEASKA